MRISGFQKFSMIDFNDKLCAVVFTQACNFQCPYCHDPELVPMLSQKPLLDQTEIMEFLKSRVGKLDAVVITGGEPLLQKNLIPFLKDIKKLGYLIKLDTNGLLTQNLRVAIESGLLDYIAMDIKTSLEDYERVVKVRISEKNLLKSIKLIKESNIDHEFRTTVIEGLIAEDTIIRIARELVKESNYYIQNFVKSHHLDKSFEDEIGFSKLKLDHLITYLQAEGYKINLRD